MKHLPLLTFAAGIIIGAGGGYHLASRHSPGAVVAKNSIQASPSEKPTLAKSAKTGTGGKDGTALEVAGSPAGEIPHVRMSEEQRAKDEAKHQKHMEKMKATAAKKLKMKVDEKLAVMTRKLGLSPAQLEAMRPLLEKHLAGGDILSMSMESEAADYLPPEERKEKASQMVLKMLDPAREEAELDGALRAMMGPEQQAAYAQLKQEQRANSVELSANKELAKIQGAMTLTNEQKDQVFAVLSALADDDVEKPIPAIVHMATIMPGAGANMEAEVGKQAASQIRELEEVAKARSSSRLDAMKGILTAEQFSIYEAQQKDRSGMMAEFMSEMGEGMFDHVVEEENSGEGGVPTESVPGK